MLAAWIAHVRGKAGPVDDPMAAQLADLWTTHGADGIIGALFGPYGVFHPVWQPLPEAERLLQGYLADLC